MGERVGADLWEEGLYLAGEAGWRDERTTAAPASAGLFFSFFPSFHVLVCLPNWSNGGRVRRSRAWRSLERQPVSFLSQRGR